MNWNKINFILTSLSVEYHEHTLLWRDFFILISFRRTCIMQISHPQNKEQKTCISHLLLNSIAREDTSSKWWRMVTRSWSCTTNFLPPVPTDQGGFWLKNLRRIVTDARETWQRPGEEVNNQSWLRNSPTAPWCSCSLSSCQVMDVFGGRHFFSGNKEVINKAKLIFTGAEGWSSSMMFLLSGKLPWSIHPISSETLQQQDE